MIEGQELKLLQKQEAIKRLKMLEKHYLLHKNVLKEFEEDETIYYSENLGGAFAGTLYWLRNQERYVKAVKEIVSKTQIYVYYCILNHTELGDMFTMLYISPYKEEWKLEREDLKSGFVVAYIKNLEDDSCSKFGGIEIRGVNGGLERIA